MKDPDLLRYGSKRWQDSFYKYKNSLNIGDEIPVKILHKKDALE